MADTQLKLTEFEHLGNVAAIQFVETQQVKDGVECDIYKFANDDKRDLAVVRIAKGFKTPLQLVMLGDETVEIYTSGDGVLSVWNEDGVQKQYHFESGDVSDGVVVGIGEKVQWAASDKSDLTFYEICTPPYEDGRFKDIG